MQRPGRVTGPFGCHPWMKGIGGILAEHRQLALCVLPMGLQFFGTPHPEVTRPYPEVGVHKLFFTVLLPGCFSVVSVSRFLDHMAPSWRSRVRRSSDPAFSALEFVGRMPSDVGKSTLGRARPCAIRYGFRDLREILFPSIPVRSGRWRPAPTPQIGSNRGWLARLWKWSPSWRSHLSATRSEIGRYPRLARSRGG